MNDKILDILLDMQKDLKDVNNRLDKIEYRMNDGFETLELLSENNSIELNKINFIFTIPFIFLHFNTSPKLCHNLNHPL